MPRSVKVTVEADGRVEFDEPVKLAGRRAAILTFLDEISAHDPGGAGEMALLSEASFAAVWDTPEEDEAWADLQDLPADPALQTDAPANAGDEAKEEERL